MSFGTSNQGATYSLSELKTNCILNAIKWLERVSDSIERNFDKNSYLYLDPDSEQGLATPLAPYIRLLNHVTTSWQDRNNASTLVADLEDSWTELFDSIGNLSIDCPELDATRKIFTQLQNIFKVHVFSQSGSKPPDAATVLLSQFIQSLKLIGNSLKSIPSALPENPIIKVGIGFPFITLCDPQAEIFRMKISLANGFEEDHPFRICGEKKWHYLKQFSQAKKNRITLVPFKQGERISLTLVFRQTKGDDSKSLLKFIRSSPGSKAQYWLEQTQKTNRSLKPL